jgi:hypothetical protein
VKACKRFSAAECLAVRGQLEKRDRRRECKETSKTFIGGHKKGGFDTILNILLNIV